LTQIFYSKRERRIYTSLVKNLTDEVIVIDKTTPCFSFTLKKEEKKPITLDQWRGKQTVHKAQICTDNDPTLTETERKEAKYFFEKDGFTQKSVMSILEKETEDMELVNDSILSEEEFLKQFKLDHLNTSTKNKLHELFKKYRQAFASHKYDIGKTKEVTMDIQLNENEPKVQKYRPIPYGAKGKVKEILDQLLKYDIIRECHEPSPFCSNIMVIPKKMVKVYVYFSTGDCSTTALKDCL